MEYVSLKTDEEVDTLTIGDKFHSRISGANYVIIDLVRDYHDSSIRSIRTDTISSSMAYSVSDGYWWRRFRPSFKNDDLVMIITTSCYDPEQQPYDEDDI